MHPRSGGANESSADSARLARLLDRADIVGVQLRYATGTDTRDWALFRSCFTDEVEIDFSDSFGQPPARMPADAWVAATAPRMESFTATQHMITNPVVVFDGDDRAICTSYVQAAHHRPGGPGGSEAVVHGTYTNRFERTPQGWRIAAVRLTVHWMTGNAGLFAEALAPGSGEPDQAGPA
ncbi:hypothetical protein GCM10027440_11210 [Nocardiopsis coralliicola]